MIDETHPGKWAGRGLYIGLVLAGLGIGLCLYWLLVPINILVIKNDPVPVRPPTNIVGGVEILTHDFCKLTDDHGVLRESFVGNGTETFLPIVSENSPASCNDKTELPVIIPTTLKPGVYHVHFRATYKPTPLQVVITEWNSQEFTIN